MIPPQSSPNCTVCNYLPWTIQLDFDRFLCDKCAGCAVLALASAEVNKETAEDIIRRMDPEPFSLDSFKNNGRSSDVESNVSARHYITPNGNEGYRGCAPLLPGCVTIQPTLYQAHWQAALCAESVDIQRKES